MIIALKNNQESKQVDSLVKWVKSLGLDVHISQGAISTVIGLIGDTSKVDIELIRSLDIVNSVSRIQEPYKNANRKFHPEDSIIDVSGVKFGGDNFPIIAGPCSVESKDQVLAIARAVKASGASMIRGGAFKPRTSPYAFQGLGVDGLDLLKIVREETGLPIVSEIMGEKYIDEFLDVDLIQVGARNMQNFDLLKQLGRINKPILLKRGLSSTIEEWLMSAEYIMSEGNNRVILCERGIRTFETYTRNTLDLSAIPILKERTHLPIIVDPSHASGLSRLVKPMSLAAVSAGCNGLLIEVHNDPARALCDGAQSLKPEQFDDIVKSINKLLPIIREINL